MKIGYATLASAIVLALTNILLTYCTEQSKWKTEQDNIRAQLDLERQQFQSNLLLRVIDPSDRNRTINGMRLLLDAGFVSEDNQKVLRVLQDTSFHIPLSTERLPIPAPESLSHKFSVTLPLSLEEIPSGKERLKRRRYPIVPYGVESKRRSFSGTVVDAITGRPLAGATVAALTTEAPESMITDTNGKFTLHFPRHKWAFFIQRAGYNMNYMANLDGDYPSFYFTNSMKIGLHMKK